MSLQSATRSYQQSSIVTANPLKMVLMVYDRAILGCQKKNLEMTWLAIKYLIDTLNMDAEPVSGRLLSIYEYCSELARNKRYSEAEKILRELRDAWASVGKT